MAEVFENSFLVTTVFDAHGVFKDRFLEDEGGTPPAPGAASLDFSQASNSQYVALLEDI